MKKPKITEGEWGLFTPPTNAHIYVKSKEHKEEVCDISFTQNREANAKAISAVPEMIDALMEAYRYMDDGDGFVRDDIKKALIKAGCTE